MSKEEEEEQQKIFGPKRFSRIINILQPKDFLSDQKHFWIKYFFRPKFFRTQIFETQVLF